MTPRRKNDILLKSVIEEFFADMLRFFAPDTDTVFDFSRSITFMDKELLEIAPETEKSGGSRYMDMLAKLWLKSGSEEWVLVHIEIQGQNDAAFARRMFTYYYRTLDKFDVSITAFALFTGTKNQQRHPFYERKFMGTLLLYQYNTFHIFDRTEEQLIQMQNPFALVVLAAQKVAQSRNITDEDMNEQRLAIARALIESNLYDSEKTQRFLSFLKNFIYIPGQEINSNFDRQIDLLTGKTKPMGIVEALQHISKEEGIEEGRKEGKKEGREEIITNLMVKFGYSDEQIFALTNVPIKTIERIRKKLNQQ